MEKQEKYEIIELLYCPRGGGENCVNRRKEINEDLREAREYFLSKEYSHGFTMLKKAYDSTFILQEQYCRKCARMFRDVIIDSCENTLLELKSMTTGVFKRKRYLTDYELAKKTLKDFGERNK